MDRLERSCSLESRLNEEHVVSGVVESLSKYCLCSTTEIELASAKKGWAVAETQREVFPTTGCGKWNRLAQPMALCFVLPAPLQ